MGGFCEFCRTLSFEKLASATGATTSIRAVAHSICPCCQLMCRALSKNGSDPIRLHKKKDGLHLKATPDHCGQYQSVRLTTAKQAGDLTISASTTAGGLRLSSLPVGKNADVSLAHEWVSACEKGHQQCQHEYAGLFTHSRRLRVVDVSSWSLTDITPSATTPYVALSYVWGVDISVKTKRSNVSDYYKHLPASLPLVYEHSIAVVRAFGMRYLWIDALCIVQDDRADITMQVNSMDRTYAEARFTIAAMVGDSANAGLNLRRPSSAATALELPTGLQLSPTIGSIHPDIAGTAWASRGWTFQERLLSRRLLMFTSKYIMLQCRLETRREDGLRSLNGYSPALDDGVPKPLRTETGYDRWAHVVEEVSARNITKPSDLIPAVTGIANIVHARYGARIVAGVCEENLHAELLWQAAEHSTLVPATTAATPVPTWSWASWVGPVKYDQMRTAAIPVADITVLAQQQLLVVGAPSRSYRHRQTRPADIEDPKIFPSELYSVMFSAATHGLRVAEYAEGAVAGWLVFDSVPLAEDPVEVLEISRNVESRNVLLVVPVQVGKTLDAKRAVKRLGIGEIGNGAWETMEDEKVEAVLE